MQETNFLHRRKTDIRLSVIDSIRGFAILTVIIGHCIQYGSGTNFRTNDLFFLNYLFKIIYSFHMPLFMVITGFCFAYTNRVKFNHVLKHRILKILLIILTWNLIYVFVTYLQTQSNPVSTFKSFVILYINSPWFLWAVIWSTLIFLIIHKIFGNDIIPHIIFSVLLMFIPDIHNFSLIKYTYIFFPIGYLLNKQDFFSKKESSNKFLIKIIIIFIVFFGTLVLYKNNVYIYVSGYTLIGKSALFQIHNNLVRFISAFSGCLLVFYIFKIFFQRINLEILNCFGKNSLGIYTSSTILFNRLLLISTNNFSGFNILGCIIETYLISIMCLIFILVAKKTKISSYLLLGQ